MAFSRLRCFRACAILATVFLSPLAVPAIGQAATAVTYAGTVRIDNSNDGRSDPISEPLSVTIDRHHVTDYSFFATLRCSDGSFMNVGLNFVQLSSAPIPLRGNALSISAGNATQGDGLTAKITGRLAGKHMSGSLQVQAHEFSGVGPERARLLLELFVESCLATGCQGTQAREGAAVRQHDD